MLSVSDEVFENLVSRAIDWIPKKYFEKIKNVAIVVEDLPSVEQREKLKLRGNQTLLGLYEGIPLTKRNSGYNLVLPDKITIFKLPILASANNIAELEQVIKKTLWHEVAHYFGLDHSDIDKLEK